MKAYVGVTDDDWYRFLAARPELREVNFWRPSSGRRFRVLASGEPFLFKTHYPHNRIVGGGFYTNYEALRLSEAWDIFGEGNGVASPDDMRSRIGKYRAEPIAPYEDPEIGCILICEPRFFTPDTALPPPADFSANLVQGKSYDLSDERQASLLERILSHLLGRDAGVDTAEPWSREGPVYGEPRLSRPRLGQGGFQAAVLNAYERRCAITGCRIRPTLQAAHIFPLEHGGAHRVDNGLLLRSDVHLMFDYGYLGVDPKFQLRVSPRLNTEFNNGEQFYALAEQQIVLPARQVDRPNREFLEWHLEKIFKSE